MQEPNNLVHEIETLRERLSRLSEASLRITEDLDLDTVLQGVVDGACSLTGARIGSITALDNAGQLQAFITFGLMPEEHRMFLELPGGPEFFAHLGQLTEPLRVADFSAHTTALGLPEIGPPLGPVGSFLGAPILLRGQRVGNIFLSDKQGSGEFSREDEETLVMFASQAALAIANARNHREEQRARADLETLVNTAPVGVVVFDARNGVPVYLNQEASRIVDGLRNPDQSIEELLETLTFSRADGREISLGEFSLAQALNAGETIRAEEIVIRVPEGRSVTTIINSTPIPSDTDAVDRMVVTLQDMTPLEELERLRAEFLAMVSHELRAPLTSIKGSAATLVGSGASLDPAETLQFHRIIEAQADHMQGLITDLLDVARIEAGALSVHPEPTDAKLLVDEARNTFLSGGGRHNVRLDLPSDLPRVMADRRRMVQVLGNLLSNAARHSPSVSSIRVSAEQEGVHVAISVADKGVGMTPDSLPYLFRKFSRMDDIDDHYQRMGMVGSGLGLAICKGIVEAQGGRIWAESDGPGLGATFTFTLPAVEMAGYDATRETTQSQTRSGREARNQIRVLVVDDDPQTLRYLRDALAAAGYSPVVTGDPEAVGRLIREERPHLVLMDLMLPETDGIELMGSIPELAETPVVFLSAYGRDEIVAQALEAGADDYIVKPFSPTELTARIQAVLRRRRPPESTEPKQPYMLGDLTVNFADRRVSLAGRPVRLTELEYKVLFELSANGGRVVSISELIQRVWGPAHPGSSGPLRSTLKNLRRKLGDDANNPTYIFNEPRVGYRMPRGETPEGEG